MEVVLIKDLHIGRKGEVKDLPEPMANYLIRVKAAEKIKGKKRVKEEKTAVIIEDEPLKKIVKKDEPE